LEDLGIDGRIVVKWIFKIKDEGVVWIDLAKDRVKWRTVVNTTMNLRIQWRTQDFFSWGVGLRQEFFSGGGFNKLS
jgi:hypothetical protein